MEKIINKIETAKDIQLIRIIVFRSNCAIYAQAFDAKGGKILSSASSLKYKKKNPTIAAREVGAELAKKISKHKAKYVFDRNGYLYHGQVMALAEGLRQGGINI